MFGGESVTARNDGKTVIQFATFFYTQIRPVGLVVSADTVTAQAIKAARYYEAFGELACLDRETEINEQSLLLNSEWAMLSPLFELYVERENALILEASRSLGVEVYGRTVSEITGDIAQRELELQQLAFQYDIITV